MTDKPSALARVRTASHSYHIANETLEQKRQELARVCKEAYAAGANDREMSEVATFGPAQKFSRARIQQLRTGT